MYEIYKKIALYFLTKVLESKSSSITDEDAMNLLTVIVESKGNKADAQLVKDIVKAL